MNPLFNQTQDKLLENIPDYMDWNKAQCWINEGRKLVQDLGEKGFFETEFLCFEWNHVDDPKPEAVFGLYPSEKWRKCVLATFFADLVSYSQSVDQVNFERLLFVMHAFPEGFRTWWMKLLNGAWWPVGYTGWYPMLELQFELFEKKSDQIKDRMVMPNIHPKDQKPYLYLFNFSVTPSLKHTPLTKILMQRFAEDINKQNAAGLASIIVSEDGARIVSRFGMSYCGRFTIDGCLESIYTCRRKGR